MLRSAMWSSCLVMGSLVMGSLLTGCDPAISAVDAGDVSSVRDAGTDRNLRDADATARDASADIVDGDAVAVDATARDASTDIVDGDTADAGPTGPMVDRSDARLRSFELSAADADSEATLTLGTQLAFLDTRAAPRGLLVVHLHGAGTQSTCGSRDHGRLLASWGFHVVSPCYSSDYNIGNCGADIGGCRLEAFEGIDHSDVIEIGPPNSIERRVARMLTWLDAEDPGGDWTYYLASADIPRWDRIVITGGSHGASTSGLIAMHRRVERAVMLSGPLDRNQSWLDGTPITPRDRFFALTHTDDVQHEGHLAAFDDLMLVGAPTVIDDAVAPYGGSHRLVTSAETSNGHSSTTAGRASPRAADESWLFEPAWRVMYGID